MNTLDDFKISQATVVALLGISMEELRSRRKNLLQENADWRRVGNAVLFSDAGVQKIRASLNVAGSPAAQKGAGGTSSAPAAERSGGGQPAPARPVRGLLGPVVSDLEKLVVYRTVTNPQIVEAHAPGSDPADRRNILRVRVRDSAHFTRGMEIPVRFVQAPDLFELAGRLPRWKGKY